MASSTTPAGKPLPTEHLDAATTALETVVDQAAEDHSIDPQAHIHQPAPAPQSHSWLRSFFPYNSLEEFEAAWHLGNYVISRKTGAKIFEPMSIYVRLGMHLLYYGSEQQKALHYQRVQDLLKSQSEKMGEQYDSPASVDHIEPFIDSFGLRDSLKDMVIEDPKEYKNFNEFFGREIKPSARPIDEPENPLAISSPADCRLTTFPTVDLAIKYWIKGYGFTLEALLGNNADLAKTFEGGSIAIARLAPQDYHRWHAPVSGTITSITDIPGTYYTVNPQAINEEGTLDVFCENKRSVMLIDRSPSKSPVAIVAVGAMLVGSIKYVDGVEVGKEVKRGQCLGAFYYGGSTVINVFPKGEVEFDSDLVKNSTEQDCETYVHVGWRMGEGPK